MKNTCPFYTVFQFLKVLLNLIKICKIHKTISADMIFQKFLELHSTLSEKKIFVTNFPFLMDSLKPHPLMYDQNQLSMTKVFC